MSHKLTAATMLSLPRPGTAQANESGTHWIMPWTHFDFGSQRTSKNVAIGQIPRPGVSSQGKHDPPPVQNILENLRFLDVVWLDADTLLYLRPRGSEMGKADVDTKLSDKEYKKLSASNEDQKPGQELWCKTLEGVDYKMGEVPVEITDLKVVRTSSTKATLAFSARVYPEDPSLDAVAKLDNKYEKALDGAEVIVFDKLFVRHWDTWTDKKKKLVFLLELQKKPDTTQATSDELDELDIQSLSSSDEGHDEAGASGPARPAHWSILSTPATPLGGLENIETPAGPFGDAGDFDITPSHLAFVAKDPHLPEAWHTRMHCYLVPLYPRNEEEKKPKCLTSQGGARSSPVFSPTAKLGHFGPSGKGKLAWLEMRIDKYESDRNRVIVYDLEKDVKYGLTEDWTLSPTSLVWGEDEKTLYATLEEDGHKKLFVLDVPDTPTSGRVQSAAPRKLTSAHNVSSASVLPHIFSKGSKNGEQTSPARLLVTMNSFTSPNEAFVLSVPASSREKVTMQQITNLSTSLTEHLSMDSGEEFWFSGADPDQQVHGFLMRPHGFEKGKQYGMVFLVHGGPQGAWTDSWSTRWNPNCWAAAGYVVVMINPTGSTGYGQEFVDAINCNWGGSPFKDLVAGLQFVKSAYSDLIDPERMAMAGGSYGGYMCNWIQGHNDVMGFKALVCHDGILDTKNAYFGTEELYFAEHDLGGTPWDVPQQYEKWSPHNHIRNWKTPELVIHGGLDYRLPDTEAIGMFNALQRKGIPSKLVYFPKENHWVLNPLNSRKWYQEVISWTEEWIGTGPSESS